MPVITANLYRRGVKVKPLSLEAPIDLSDPDDFVWIGLADPEDGELRRLEAQFALHPLAVEDALVAHQLPKLDVYGDQIFVVARIACLMDGDIHYGETDMFLGPQHLITVRHGSARAHATVRKQVESSPALLANGGDYVLHAILDFIVDGYLPIVETIEEEVLAMEQRALEVTLERAEVARIFTLRRELTRFQRNLAPMAELCSKLVRLDLPCVDAVTRPYFQDVLDHVGRVESLVAGARDILTSVFEVSMLLEQQRQGAISRQLAAWAAILAVPTALAGIYGMNFENMPELKWKYGYFMVLGVMTTVCLVLYLRFKKAKWL